MVKTNAMRLLDQAGIFYETKEYEYDEEHLGGELVAERVGLDPDQVFKTLVARGEKNGILVFCLPCNQELDLKKAAVLTKDKKVEMTHVKELLGLTGYIRGGCSPVGMKKKYPIYIEETAVLYDKISVSAGVRGCQMILKPEELIAFTGAVAADVIKER